MIMASGFARCSEWIIFAGETIYLGEPIAETTLIDLKPRSVGLFLNFPTIKDAPILPVCTSLSGFNSQIFRNFFFYAFFFFVIFLDGIFGPNPNFIKEALSICFSFMFPELVFVSQ